MMKKGLLNLCIFDMFVSRHSLKLSVFCKLSIGVSLYLSNTCYQISFSDIGNICITYFIMIIYIVSEG